MPEQSVYVTKTTLEGAEEVRVDGRSVIEAYPILQATLQSRGGRELPLLFAEPVVTRGNDANPTSISWYAAFDAEPIRLTSLDPGARATPEARLREELAALSRLLDDDEVGLLLGGSLQIGGLDDIWVLDGRPLLTNWGVLPAAAAHGSRAREEHFQQTLGRYMALRRAPPLSADDWRARHDQAPPPGLAAGAAAGTAAGAGAAVAMSGGSAAAGPDPADGGGGAGAGAGGGAGSGGPLPPGGGGGNTIHVVTSPRGRPWLAPLIAVVVLALILLFLLLPGVLLYPPEPAALAAPGLDQDLALRRDINEALRERLEALRGAVADNVCRADGELVLPDGRTPDGLTPRQEGETGARETPLGPSPQALLPPDPQQLVPPDDGAAPDPSFTGSLVDLLDQATVLVVVAGENGGFGSGFFVAPNTVVTNRHVVEGANPDQLFVTSQALGGLHPARVLQITDSSDIGSPDYAVLDVPGVEALPQLALASHVARLDNVVAGGFPGIVMESDISFQALRNGDPTAIPQMAVTQGVVTVIQQVGQDLPAIIHTANISPGNSGGPLIDSCGRVVGVNTFIRVDQESSSHLNFALQASALASFLSEHDVPHRLLDDTCQPRLAQAAPPAPPGPEPAPEPEPTPGNDGAPTTTPDAPAAPPDVAPGDGAPSEPPPAPPGG